MVGDLERRLTELRFVEGIEKVEHVPYQTGDEFWVRFSRPLDLAKLQEMTQRRNLQMIGFGGLPSKLPRGLAEILWDGVTLIITKKITGWQKFTASLGFEPSGVAKIAVDLHGPYQIFIATDEEGVQILYEYLGLKYVPPPPPKPAPAAAPTKPVAATVAKPAPAAPPPRPAPPSATPPEVPVVPAKQSEPMTATQGQTGSSSAQPQVPPKTEPKKEAESEAAG